MKFVTKKTCWNKAKCLIKKFSSKKDNRMKQSTSWQQFSRIKFALWRRVMKLHLAVWCRETVTILPIWLPNLSISYSRNNETKSFVGICRICLFIDEIRCERFSEFCTTFNLCLKKKVGKISDWHAGHQEFSRNGIQKWIKGIQSMLAAITHVRGSTLALQNVLLVLKITVIPDKFYS